MTDAALPFPVATLLAERPWVRGVARALVRDEAAADDLAQDAWVAALVHDGGAPRAPRGWLATVLRRAASKGRRTERRREARERVVARPEATASTLDVVAQAEWHRRVVEAVLALDEPYRTAVLLRFFEDLPPREVAARTGEPVATVRSRVQRGLERLREAFDRGAGGDRRAWRGALGSLSGTGALQGFSNGGGTGSGRVGAAGEGVRTGAAPSGAPGAGAVGTTSFGGLLMATKGKAALVAAIVALIGGGTWWFARARDASAPQGIGNALPLPDRGAGTPPPGLAAAGRASGPGPADVPAGAVLPPPPPDSAPGTVEPRIRFRSGALLLTVEEARRLYAAAAVEPTVVLVAEEELTGGTPGRTYARTFSGETNSWQRPAVIDWTGAEPKVTTKIEPGRWWAIVARPGLPPAFVRTSGDPSGGLAFEVDLRPSGRATRVRLVDPETKEPVLGARVVPYVEFGDDAAFVAGPALVADRQGEVDLPLADPGEDPWRPVSWWALAPGRAAKVPLAGATPPSKETVLEVLLLRTATVSGHAWAADGTPAVGAMVSGMARKGYGVSTRVGADGTYELAGVACSGEGGSRERIALLPNAAGLDALLVAVQVQPGARVALDLGAPPDPAARLGRLRGRLTAGGKPLVGCLVGLGRERFGETAADGTFRFDGLRPGPTKLRLMLGDPRVSDDAMVRGEAVIVSEAGEVVLDLDLPEGLLRVRVIDGATGAPVAGAWVSAAPEGERADSKRFPGLTWQIGWSGVTDAEGIAWMRGLPPDARFRVVAQGPVRAGGTAQVEGIAAGTGAAAGDVTLKLLPDGR